MSLIPNDLYAYAIEVALQAYYNKSEIEWTLASHMILYCWNNLFSAAYIYSKKKIEINVIKIFNEENELVHSNQLTFELKQISTKLVQPIRRIVNYIRIYGIIQNSKKNSYDSSQLFPLFFR